MTTRSQPQTKTGRAKPTRKIVPAPAKAKDAIAMLKEDHRRVEDLFSQFESARKGERKLRIVQSICAELTLHAALEETEFYPLAREFLKKDEDLLDEAEVEHASLKWLIAQLETVSPESDLYDAKVTVLKEYVSHHVKEEEKEMFPKVRKSALDTAALGATMQAAKERLQQTLRH